MLTSEVKRTGVTGFGLLGILLGMAFSATGGTDVLAGCCRKQQRGQYKDNELPDESSAELNLTSEYACPLGRNLTECRGRDSQIGIGAGKSVREIIRLAA